jgi:hypothetical protein
VHTQINVSTPEEVLFFGTAALIKAARNQAVLGLTARDSVPQENEINTARRLLKIGFAPVDWLYSESLTKSTKSTKNQHQKNVELAPVTARSTASSSTVTIASIELSVRVYSLNCI